MHCRSLHIYLTLKGEEVLTPPTSESQKFVHMCDYLASRKFLEVKFDTVLKYVNIGDH